eukprot:112213-Pleurochrysis_carterae.AAC.1
MHILAVGLMSHLCSEFLYRIVLRAICFRVVLRAIASLGAYALEVSMLCARCRRSRRQMRAACAAASSWLR